jgi:hypothetical protein
MIGVYARAQTGAFDPAEIGPGQQAGRTGDVYKFRTSSEEEVRDFCVSPLRVPEPCRLAERDFSGHVNASSQDFACCLPATHYGAITEIAARFGPACVATSMGAGRCLQGRKADPQPRPTREAAMTMTGAERARALRDRRRRGLRKLSVENPRGRSAGDRLAWVRGCSLVPASRGRHRWPSGFHRWRGVRRSLQRSRHCNRTDGRAWARSRPTWAALAQRSDDRAGDAR